MSVNADWRTFAFLGSLGLFALLLFAGGMTRLLRKPLATLWLASLARFSLVFFLAFTLLSLGALLAPAGLEPLGLKTAARYVDEPEMASLWAVLAVIAGCAAFRDRFHRPSSEAKL